ncbi:hypothetical protein QQS21_007991 [Conoideocrella luteorostrata]|uniref:Zn(2)-C6 fungal-type domain-containing protein n=1 Tax=Conoideocrella luteorostrata TaxID=1105319 RepID=A0AAJ0FZ10_9HYPO|nr:hypothetical protein QQS21_007991 [Conoideocrella luteorostrata]
MSEVSPSARPSGRKGSRKVRTGCITCKLRKVKCDEAKPACLRCLRSGRLCDGYLDASTRSETLIRHISPTVEFENADGRRAFDYYHSRLVPVLSGIYNSEFWGETVLQLGLTEAVVHHSLLSLSSFLECGLAKDGIDRTRERNYAFREYGKAITAMREWNAERGTMAIPLLVCVLLTCIEFILDRGQASQLHICQGRRLLSHLENKNSPSLDMVKRDLVPMFSRLSLACFLFGSRPEPIPDMLKNLISTPSEFMNLRDAKDRLYHLLDDALRFSLDGRLGVYGESPDYVKLAALEALQQSLICQLTDWNNAFALLTTTLPQNSSTRMAQSLLQMYYQASISWVCIALQPGELAYDSHIQNFASIVSHASSVVNQTNASKKLPDFSFETELIAPLYWVAVKCRHPALRRAALRILLKDEVRNRKENLWSAKESIVIAARIIEIEEGSMFKELEHSSLPVESPMRETTPSTISSSSTSSAWWIDQDLQVFLTQPPTLSHLRQKAIISQELDGDAEFSFEEPVQPVVSEPSEHPSLRLASQLAAYQPKHLSLSPPFDIPETQRIKNTLVGPRQPGGVWITNFRDLGDGQGQYDITKEFLQVG